MSSRWMQTKKIISAVNVKMQNLKAQIFDFVRTNNTATQERKGMKKFGQSK